MGLVAPQHVGSSWTRDQTRVPCIGRRILNYYATRESRCWTFKIAIYTNARYCSKCFPCIHSFNVLKDLMRQIWLVSVFIGETEALRSRLTQAHLATELNLCRGSLAPESMLLTLLVGECMSKWEIRWDWGMKIFKNRKILQRFESCFIFLAAKVPWWTSLDLASVFMSVKWGWDQYVSPKIAVIIQWD